MIASECDLLHRGREIRYNNRLIAAAAATTVVASEKEKDT
jgi:hypothetical protein